jgi:hypothetical protein
MMQREKENGGVSHAIIIWGGTEADRLKRSQQLAARFVCASPNADGEPCMASPHCAKARRGIHPDIVALDRNPENRLFSVEQVRALVKDAVVMPNEADRKVYILNHADSMNVAAQNAILKLLEEPPGESVFLLLAESPAALLPTVRSRCAEIRAAEEPMPEQNDMASSFCSALFDGPLALTELSFTLEKLGRNEWGDFIAAARAILGGRLKDALTKGRDAGRILHALSALDKASDYLEFNVGAVHLAGMLCAELIAETPKER